MAGDDETIVIRVNAAQGEAALRALGKAGIEAGAGIEKIGPAASGVDLNLKDLTRNIGAGISLIALLRDNLEALKPVLDDVGTGIKFAATQAGASEETVSNLGLAFDSLIHPSHIAANAVESMGRAWAKFEEAIVGSSTVIPNGVRTIEQSLTALAAARKAAAEVQTGALGDEQKALAATAKEEAALEAAAIKSSQERAKAEAQAAAEIVAALERESQALAAKLAQDEARLQQALDKGSKLDNRTDTSEATKALGDLKEEIKDLESQPLLSPEQLNQLNELHDRAGQAERGLRDLNNVYTTTANNFLDESQSTEAAAAAWDVYRDRLDKAQFEHERAMDSIDGSSESFGNFEDAASGAGEALDGVAEAAGEMGDETKKGSDKAKEGLDDLKAGAEEAIPLLNQIKTLLAEIQAAAAAVDL